MAGHLLVRDSRSGSNFCRPFAPVGITRRFQDHTFWHTHSQAARYFLSQPSRHGSPSSGHSRGSDLRSQSVASGQSRSACDRHSCGRHHRRHSRLFQQEAGHSHRSHHRLYSFCASAYSAVGAGDSLGTEPPQHVAHFGGSRRPDLYPLGQGQYFGIRSARVCAGSPSYGGESQADCVPRAGAQCGFAAAQLRFHHRGCADCG